MTLIHIIAYKPCYCTPVAHLFYQAVHAIPDTLYSQQEKAVWAPWPPDQQFWSQRLQQTQPWIAVVESQLAGFIEFNHQGYIDCLYTHPAYQRRGIASMLLRYITQRAVNEGIETLSSHVSKAALPFFIHHGFTLVRQNQVRRQGVTLINYLMEKSLSQTQATGSAPE